MSFQIDSTVKPRGKINDPKVVPMMGRAVVEGVAPCPDAETCEAVCAGLCPGEKIALNIDSKHFTRDGLTKGVNHWHCGVEYIPVS